MLVAELKKIEVRKKEREKKQLELNKLITAAENKPQASEHKMFQSRLVYFKVRWYSGDLVIVFGILVFSARETGVNIF